MRVARLLAGAVAWLGGVAGVAGVGWFAIDSAGDEVGAPEDAVDVGVAPGLVPSASAPPPTVDDLGPARRAASPSVSVSPTATPSATPAAYQSASGQILLQCAGSSPLNATVRPANGWRVEAKQLQSEFDARFLDDAGHVLLVRGICHDGVLTFVTGPPPSSH